MAIAFKSCTALVLTSILFFGAFFAPSIAAGDLRAIAENDAFPDFVPSSEANGDVNGDLTIDISDAVYLLMWRFGGGAEPVTLRCERPALENGDVNGDRRRDISDAVYLLGWRFAGGPAPRPGCDTDPGRDVHEDHDEDMDSIPYLQDPRLIQSTSAIPERFHGMARPLPIYKLRIHAIRTANNDGSEAATITPAQVQQLVEQANVVYYSSGIEFEFDPARDFEHKNATILNNKLTVLDDLTQYTDPEVEPPSLDTWNTAFKNAVADVHPGKIVVYFSFGGKLVFDEALGHWKRVASAGGSSSWFSRFVNMPRTMPEKNLLAHEVGHYLHNGHPFAGGIETVAEASERIRKYVDDDGHPAGDGLDALDGDRDFVLDTPPDAGGAIFQAAFGDKCGPNDSLNIPVNLASGKQTYVLEPNRHLIMSYFKGCHDLGHWLSAQQISRTRDSLENGNRHHLVGLPPGASYAIDRLGSALAGPISASNLVRVGHRRLVSVVITSGRLKLIVWDVSEDGMTIERKGDALAGGVDLISSVSMGLGMVATAVRLADGSLKVIVWQVTAAGEVERRGDATGGQVTQISACRVGIRYLATAVRNGSGNLETIIWRVYADGAIHRECSSEAGKINEVAAATLGDFGVLTAVRDSQNYLKVIGWQIPNDASSLTRQSTVTAGQVSAISSVHLDTEVLTTAVRLPSGVLRVITWHVDQFGVMQRRESVDGGSVNEIASARLGTGHLVTACADAGNDLALDLWSCKAAGLSLRHESSATGGGATDLGIARLGEREFVTSVRLSTGELKLIAWKLQPSRVARQ